MSNTAQVVNAQAAARAADAGTSMPAPIDPGVPAAAPALFDSTALRTIAEPIAAVAHLTGRSSVLITGCRAGDGASSIAGALALDLAARLGIDTLLVGADLADMGHPGEDQTRGNGRPVRIRQTAIAHLWTAQCFETAAPERSIAPPANGGQTRQDGLVDEVRQAIGRYRAAVVDLGVMRLDARMLALAGPEDPVLVVARYGCTRRDELAATLAILKLAKCRIGGVILNGYESPAVDRLQWIAGFGRSAR